ncbi:MAG: InlB B-repeat-containing protein [Clostridiales bacterium]|nr:InlB B-repeat-containing protein [Clostridiales bacterium]
MKTTKRILSLLLAMIMTFSVMTVAFVSVSAAAPYVARTPDTMPNPTFIVPDYIETYGTNEYLPGSQVKPIEQGIKFYLQGATNISFSCVGNVSLSTQYTSGNETCADIESGTATANSYVEFDVSYRYNNTAYVTRAYSWVKPATNPGGVFMDWFQEKANWHTAVGKIFTWVTPSIGSFEHYVPSLVSSGSGSGYMALGYSDYTFNYDISASVGQYKWYYHDDPTIPTAGTTDDALGDDRRPTATYYADVSRYSNLNETDLKINIKHVSGTLDSSHKAMVRDLKISEAKRNTETATSDYSITGYSNYDMTDNTTVKSFGFAGVLPGANGTVTMETQVTYKLQAGDSVTASCNNTVKIKVKVLTYDKSALRTLVESEKAANRQQGHYSTAAWQVYAPAYANAYSVLGKPNATQSEINSAKNTLSSAVQTLTTQGGVSSADYTAVDRVLQKNIPDDFNSHPEYYTDSTRQALERAIEDVEYDRPLNIFYQSVVNEMATNLYNAAVALEYNSYNVIFNTNGGTVQSPIRQKYKSLVQEPETTTAKGGYVFAGWYLDSALTEPVNWPITMPYNGITVYAAWDEDRTTIEFDTNGGSSIPSASVLVHHSYGGPGETPTKNGYNFMGWYYDAALEQEVTFPIYDIPRGGYVLYAKWEPALYYITFYTNGGSNVDPIAARYGESVDAPPEPIKDASNFIGWYPNNGALGGSWGKKVTWPITMPAQNVTYYAQWTKDYFRIIYDSDGGTAIPEETHPEGDPITAPANPVKQGYDFMYWSYAGAQWTFDTMPGFNLTLKAVWQPKEITIFFNTQFDDIQIAPIRQLCGTVVAAPEMPEKEGYMFMGWLLNGEPYTFTTMPTTNITLIANWIETPDIAKIKIRTDLPEGKTELEPGDLITVTLSLNTNFYCATSSFIVYFDKRYYGIAVDGGLYTTLTTGNALRNKGVITEIDNLNGALGWNFWQTGTLGGRTNSTYNAGYYPASWRTGPSNTLGEDYAYYDYIHVQYTSSASGQVPAAGTIITVDPEQDVFSFQLMVRDTAEPTPDGEFARIFLTEDAIKGTGIAANHKLYVTAKSGNFYSTDSSDRDLVYQLDGDLNYTIVEREVRPTHTITFNSAGGSAVPSVEAEETRKVQAPTSPSWANHDFDGWYLDDELVTWPLTMPDHDITLVAHWIAHKADYTVKHYKQNATGIGYSLADTETFNDVIGSEVVGQPKEYTGFYYFEDNSETTGEVLADGSLVLSLRYMRNVSTLTFNSAGGTAVAPITQRYATEVTPPAAPTRTGFRFVNWTPALPETMPANDMSFTAVWEPNLYTITFILNGDVISSEQLAYGDTIVVPTVNVPAGKTFSGWSPAVPTTVPATDMTFNASLDEGGFSVVFILDGVQVSSSKVQEGGAIIIPSVTIPDGYKFNGWSPAVPDTMPTPGSNMTFTGTTSKKRITVTFMLDSGNGEYMEFESYTRLFQAEYDIPAPYVQSGWTFVGWYDNAELTGNRLAPKEGTEDKGEIPAFDTTYYGVLSPAQFTYRFYINNKLEKTVTGPTGTAVEAPAIPVGHTFSGWSPAVPTSIGGEDQDFYGTLTINQYTIYFYVNSVRRDDLTITQDYGTPITAPTVSQQNYTFSGWSPEVPETMPANNLSVYGTLSPSIGIVSFDANGATGVVPSNTSGIYGEEIDLPGQGSLRMPDCRFLGWNTDKDAKKALDSYTISQDSVVLYAIWRNTSEDVVELTSNDEDVYIDTTRSYIYGIPTGISISRLQSLFEVTGEGYITIEASGRYAGTGTIVSLYDMDDNLLHTYTIVVFGDLDGNGRITGADASIASQALAEGFGFAGEYADVFRFAANVEVLSPRDTFKANDVSIIWAAVSEGGISQVELAQIYEYFEY